ncbi:MAG TPA: glycosyltransferase [Thermoanaerobaculia bacterium]|nr:glycosyltransferase [Thermoanaerobaculia bacterium]
MISLVVVNYRSAGMAVEAIRTARAASRETLEVVVVDNSCDEAEAERLRPVADTLLVSATNRGYAGAINDARPYCAGEIVVITNPDVVFFPGAIDHLAASLEKPGRAVAGPALYWDVEQEWILPPADGRTLARKFDEILASRAAFWRARRDRRRIRERLAFWSLTETTTVRAISGAVMAIRRDVLDATSGFDERFPLYFEESDFLRRLERRRLQTVYVPEARCRHIYNQSAGAERERAAALYEASERAYWAKWYGKHAAAVVTALQRAPSPRPVQPCQETWALPRAGLLIEASPLPDFPTAAGHFAKSTTVRVPSEVWERYRDAALYLRAVDPGTATTVATCVRYRS